MTTTYKGYTEEQLNLAFEKVKNTKHWKGPISAYVKPEDADECIAAIEFYAYGGVYVQPVSKELIRIVAPGYWSMEAQRERY